MVAFFSCRVGSGGHFAIFFGGGAKIIRDHALQFSGKHGNTCRLVALSSKIAFNCSSKNSLIRVFFALCI